MITLNKEDIIRMAKEADPDVVFEEFLEDHVLVFKRFAALVAATSATAEREWQGLTDAEMMDLELSAHDLNSVSIIALRRFGRAVEAKLREKNT